tara:strand:+ start:118 stop:606 length:489 start_codon:yes stop_codon:yes gene_type:complete
MIICGIIGLKNSGKTFIVQKLIQYFIEQKFKVGSIKHAHHNFEIDYPNTDSFLHRKAGSQQVIVSSKKRWAKIVELNDSKEKTLKELLSDFDSLDIVIIEGFKKENHPKIEIIDKKNNNYLFPKLQNVIGIICDEMIDISLPQFNKSQIKEIANHIINNAKI